MSTFITELAALAARSPSADNAQPWRLTWTGRLLEIGYAERQGASTVFPAHSHATLLGVGALAENIDMALAANGLRGHWQWSDADRQPYGTVALPDVPAAFRTPDGPLKRHTNRLAFRREPLPAELVERLGACHEGGNRVTILRHAADLARLVRMVRLCSEARFCNRALHQWLFDSLRCTPAEVRRGDGLDLNSLGLPPGGKSLLRFISDWGRMRMLNRLGAYKLLARSEVALLAAAPALLCITGLAGQRSVIDAGRLLTRVWTDLNLAGIAVQPYYVVSDQLNRLHQGTLASGFDAKIGAVEREMHSLLGLAQEQSLHMILRLGYPKAIPVRSRRLAPGEVFSDHAR